MKTFSLEADKQPNAILRYFLTTLLMPVSYVCKNSKIFYPRGLLVPTPDNNSIKAKYVVHPLELVFINILNIYVFINVYIISFNLINIFKPRRIEL